MLLASSPPPTNRLPWIFPNIQQARTRNKNGSSPQRLSAGTTEAIGGEDHPWIGWRPAAAPIPPATDHRHRPPRPTGAKYDGRSRYVFEPAPAGDGRTRRTKNRPSVATANTHCDAPTRGQCGHGDDSRWSLAVCNGARNLRRRARYSNVASDPCRCTATAKIRIFFFYRNRSLRKYKFIMQG